METEKPDQYRPKMLDSLPKSSSVHVQAMLQWLRNCGGLGIDDKNILIQTSSGKGIGVFAARDFTKGETLFSLPRKCILGLGDALQSELVKRVLSIFSKISKDNNIRITGELLIWIAMSFGRIDDSSHFSPYLSTLDSDNIPSMLVWETELTDTLNGTNLGKSHCQAMKRLTEYEGIISLVKQYDDSVSIHSSPIKRPRTEQNSTINNSLEFLDKKGILWARAHYLSRRYPGYLSSSFDASHATSFDHEENMGSFGAMCPLLDLLNHDSSKDWLNLIVDEHLIHIVANHPISQGQEIFYNYGNLSNEMLLFGYGYAVQDNPDDSVAVQLMAMNSKVKPPQPYHVGTYYIKSGGFDGIPKIIWTAIAKIVSGDGEQDDNDSDDEIAAEDCQLLCDWMKDHYQKILSHQDRANQIFAKCGVLDLNDESGDYRAKFLKIYRDGQLKIVTESIEALENVLDEVAVEDDDDSQNV